MKKTKSIDKVVTALIRERNFEWKLLEQKVFELWRTEVDGPLANHAHPVAFSDGILTVYTESPVYNTELSFHKPKIIARLNAHLKKPIVTELRLKVLQLPASSRYVRKESAPTKTDIRQNANADWAALTSDTLGQIEAVLVDVTDETLKTALRQLFITQTQDELRKKRSDKMPIEVIIVEDKDD